jgi:hypothetical protein
MGTPRKSVAKPIFICIRLLSLSLLGSFCEVCFFVVGVVCGGVPGYGVFGSFSFWLKYGFMQSVDFSMMWVVSDMCGEFMLPFMLNLLGMVVFCRVCCMSANVSGLLFG